MTFVCFFVLALGLAATFASAHPTSPASPSALAIASGTPFDMQPQPTILARESERASPIAPIPTPPRAPAWSPAPIQPLIPTPVATVIVTSTTPASPSYSYSWAETHDDSKNTRQHELIAGIIVGVVLGLGMLVCIVGVCVNRCRPGGGKLRNKGVRVPDVEHGVVTPAEAVRRDGPGYVQPLMRATRGPDGRFSHMPVHGGQL
ncbi:hypothetical protein IQ06DRAFT_353619 [Phaeosphaeriaceae sp. SRC1lsM3a]|nr:hypothetical protein IQ06DRAFT_353619 [Stagonospora sp. SRC1lsM3a]